MKKNKILAAVTAAVLSGALVLGGTYAWQSISQRALNEAASEPNNPGGRLHDDFDGTNKDIYVENFTDPLDGVAIYARIRLNEYMEFGRDAGINTEAADRKAVPVMEGADINDMSTWKTYVPGEEGNTIHDTYWNWTMGGETVYMPTFNKNRDSLAADVNGTFAGPDDDPSTHKDRYEDYVAYGVGDTVTGNAVYDADDNDVDEGEDAVEGENINTVEETHTAKSTQSGTVITMAEWKAAGANPGKFWVYDTDGWAYWAEAIEPGEATGLLLDGIELKEDQKERWYYAIDVTGQFATAGDWGDKTEGTGFYEDGISEDALFLLNLVSGKLRIVTGADGKQYINNGDGTFQEKKEDGTLGDLIWAGPDKKPGNEDDKPIIIGEEDGKKYVDNGDGTYSEVKENGTLGDPIYPGADGIIGTGDDKPVVTGEDGKKYVDNGDGTYSQIQENGTLGTPIYPGADKKIGTEDDQTVTVIDPEDPTYGSKFVGPNEDGSYYAAGPDGMFGTGDDVTKVWPNPTLSAGNIVPSDPIPVDKVTVTAADDAKAAYVGTTLQFTAKVTKNGTEVSDQRVTWKVSGNTSANTTINASGLLTVGEDENIENLKVTATSMLYTDVSGELEIKIQVWETVTFDNIDFYVLARDEENSRALIWSTDILPEKKIFNPTDSLENLKWENSSLRSWLNSEWLESCPTLNALAIETTITTNCQAYTNTSVETVDRAFLLSYRDVEKAVANAEYYGKNCPMWTDYTYNNEGVVPAVPRALICCKNADYWLRTGFGKSDGYCILVVQTGENNISSIYYRNMTNTPYGVRPALWVPLDAVNN